MTTPEPVSTRALMAAEIMERVGSRAFNSAWAQADLVGAIGSQEWVAMHAGQCEICPDADARLYPCGWRCESHRPGSA